MMVKKAWPWTRDRKTGRWHANGYFIGQKPKTLRGPTVADWEIENPDGTKHVKLFPTFDAAKKFVENGMRGPTPEELQKAARQVLDIGSQLDSIESFGKKLEVLVKEEELSIEYADQLLKELDVEIATIYWRLDKFRSQSNDKLRINWPPVNDTDASSETK